MNRSSFWRKWGALIIILGVAILLRLGFIPDIGLRGDFEAYSAWIDEIRAVGLFKFYDPALRFDASDRTYPALATTSFGALGVLRNTFPSAFDDRSHPASYVALLKLFPVLCELALIVVVYIWLQSEKVPRALRYMIPGLLAISPALVLINAWWGQVDSPYVLCAALSLLALNRDRPLASWAALGASVMFKQLGIVLLPMVLVLSWRRYGLRPTAVGLGIFGAICVGLTVPFILATSLTAALSPFLSATSIYPNITNGSLNLWYIVGALTGNGQLPDSALLIGPLSYKAAGFILFGSYLLVLLVFMWRDSQQRQEFIWAAALYCGFFVLLTEVQSRYLYPGAVFAIIAIAQARNLRFLAWGFLATFAYNTILVLLPEHRPRLDLASNVLGVPVSLLNIVLTAFVTVAALRVRNRAVDASVPRTLTEHS